MIVASISTFACKLGDMSIKSDLDNSFALSNSPSPIKALTSNAQRAFDLAGELYTLTQQWTLLCTTGRNLISNISLLKENAWNTPEVTINSQKLECQCEQLSSILKEMEGVVKQIEKIKDQYTALVKLQEFQQAKQSHISQDNPPFLFLTWPTVKFAQVAEVIKNAYDEELKVKACIIENLADCDNREAVNFHKIAWVHQVNITPHVKLLLESLLLETGQR